VDARGAFAFSSTFAPGVYEIAASTGLGRATRRSVTLYPTRTLDLALGATVNGHIQLDVTSTTAATVRIEGLPVETTAAGSFQATHFMTIEHRCLALCAHDGSCDSGFRCTPDLGMPARGLLLA
jgi:hypothetical protein